MNYRHLYHAGNFADVFKHVLLMALLEKLQQKNTPFCVLDTHAGIGLYDLYSEAASKTGEYKEGIGRLYHAPDLSPLLQRYRHVIASFNMEALRYYPGSPCIASHLLRPEDRLVLAELHPEDVVTLKDYFRRAQQVAVHHSDAYHSMKAFLPPKEKRGLVLIDPPFEKEGEYARIAKALALACERFHHGVYAIWYPIKDRLPVDYFHKSLLATKAAKILVLELLLQPDNDPSRLNGSGIAIINAPWKLDEEAALWLPELHKLLAEEGKGTVRIEWLRGA